MGWNVVTGYLHSGARGLGRSDVGAHDERYDAGDDFMAAAYQLFEGSWDTDAAVRDRDAGIFTRPAGVRRVTHQGPHFQVDGIHLAEPSPQRTPVLFQAGSSKRGMEFAGRHAECVFTNGHTKQIVGNTVRTIRGHAAANGRDPQDVKIFVGATVITAPTSAEAQEKYQEIRHYIDAVGTLALQSGWTGIDFAEYGLDDPIRYVKSNAIQSRVESMTLQSPDKVWTVRDLAHFGPSAGRGPFLVGSPAEVADALIGWIDEADLDGFNLTRVLVPDSLTDIVDLLVPELQNRGRFKTAYAPGSLREKLFGTGQALLPATHPGAAYRAVPLANAG
jgi:long-chain alkane monooxygenase